MRIVLFLLLGIATGRMPAAEPETRTGRALKFDEKAIAFGVATSHGRLGITKPKAIYRVHHSIDISAFYDHPAWHYRPSSSRFYDFSPLEFPHGAEMAFLTCPDGSTIEFPVDTRIDILLPREAIWDSPGGYGIGYQLDRLIRKPGVYKLRWTLADMESPTVSFRVIRHRSRLSTRLGH